MGRVGQERLLRKKNQEKKTALMYKHICLYTYMYMYMYYQVRTCTYMEDFTQDSALYMYM